MERETNKNKPLSKEETKGLLSLIENSKIINNKQTNATNNKMKIEEWVRITDIFNATLGTCRRTPQQLRLKWENLKKNSRKRSSLIRMERFKTGGGPPGYFPPDDILDRVAALLGSTGEGLTVLFGGDAEASIIGDGDSGGGSSQLVHIPVYNTESPTMLQILVDSPLPMIANPPSVSTLTSNEVPANSIGDGLNPENYLGTPIVTNKKRFFRSSGIKRKLLQVDDGRQARNLALAEYYTEKKKLLELFHSQKLLEVENIKLQNEKLKLELRKLKGDDV